MVNKDYLHKKFQEWRKEVKENIILIVISLIIVAISIIIGYFSGFYVSYEAKVIEVSDLILKYFGPYNFRFIFVYGYLLYFVLLFIYPLFFNVKKLHSVIFQFSVLNLCRSFFIIFTHLKTPSDAISGAFPGALNLFKFSNDSFFSGHVAIPFLGFLLFRESKIRYFFLFMSIIMGIIVLGMHQHYSIDVFAAFFITYGCYKIGSYIIVKLEKLFKKI